MEKNDLVNDTWQHSHYFGNILFQIEDNRINEKGYLLFPALALIIEKSLKFSLSSETDYYERSFKSIIQLAKSKKIITIDEFNFLNHIRYLRNKLFHGFDEQSFLEIDGKGWAIIDNDTHIFLYDLVILNALKLILKLITM